MKRFKLKLDQNELKLLWSCCMRTIQTDGKAIGLIDLAAQETVLRLAERLDGMFRCDKQKYTLRLSTMEAYAVRCWFIPMLEEASEPWMQTAGYCIADELERQRNHEISVFNARYHHE